MLVTLPWGFHAGVLERYLSMCSGSNCSRGAFSLTMSPHVDGEQATSKPLPVIVLAMARSLVATTPATAFVSTCEILSRTEPETIPLLLS